MDSVEESNFLKYTVAAAVGITTAGVLAYKMGGPVVLKESPTLKEADQPEEVYSQYSSSVTSWSISDRTKAREPLLSKSGIAASEPLTVGELFAQSVKRFGDKPILRAEDVPSVVPKGEAVPPSRPLAEWSTW